MKKLVPTFLGLFILSLLVLPVVGCSGGGGTDSSPESISDDLNAEDDLLPDTDVDGADDA